MGLTTERGGEHRLTIPDHDPMRVGTLAGILSALARHHRMSREQLIELLFGLRS